LDTHDYVVGLQLGLIDLAYEMYNGRWKPRSKAIADGYRDAIDDSDEPRDEDHYPTAHLADALVDGFRIACDAEDRVVLVTDQIQHVDCPDCQANHDAERDALDDSDDMPDPFDPEETLRP
jgi:hypothetical protein